MKTRPSDGRSAATGAGSAVAAALLVGVVPALSGIRRGLPIPGLRLSEVLIVALAVPAVADVVRRRRIEWRALDTLAVAYIAVNALVCVIGLLRRDAALGSAELQTVLGPVAFYLLYRCVMFYAPTERARQVAVRSALIASVPVFVLALLQAFHFPYVADLLADLTGVDVRAIGSQRVVERATGPFPHWHAASGYAFMILLLATATLFRAAPHERSRWALAAQGLACLAIAASASVTAMAGALLGVCALLAWERPWRSGSVAWLWPLAIVAIASGLFVGAQRLGEQQRVSEGIRGSGEVPLSVAYRGTIWRDQYLPAIEQHLLVGYGPGRPPSVVWPYSESLYITYLLRGGLLLLAVYLALMLCFAWTGWRASQARPELVALCGRCLLVAVVLLVPMHLLTTYFISAGLPYLVWGLAGLCSRTAERNA